MRCRTVRVLEFAGSRLADASSNMAKSPGPEFDAADLAVLDECPAGELYRGNVPEHLFHPASGERRFGTEPLELVGMMQKGEGPSGDQVDRRLVPGHQ